MSKKSVTKTLEDRKKTHGDFTVHAEIAQSLKEITGSYDGELNHVQREAVDMILHKIARILAGNPNEKDHWHDIAGYAKLVEDRIKE